MKCGLFHGNVIKLTDDIQLLKPTVFPSVPRLLNRIQQKLKAKMEDTLGVKGWLVKKAIQSKVSYYHRGKGLTHIAYDNMIFNKMKYILGGKVRMMITGSAPISSDVLDFLKVCFSCPIVEGYGLTETMGSSTMTYLNDPHSGHVGGPI